MAVLRGVSDWALHGERCSAPVLIRGVFGSGKSRTLAASVVLLDRLLRQRKDAPYAAGGQAGSAT